MKWTLKNLRRVSMATIECTKDKFLERVNKFIQEAGRKSNTQERVKAAHRAVTLSYLGLNDVSEEDLEMCAEHLVCATEGAIARGWDL